MEKADASHLAFISVFVSGNKNCSILDLTHLGDQIQNPVPDGCLAGPAGKLLKFTDGLYLLVIRVDWSWFKLLILGDSWWFLVILGDSWWFLVILGDSWWFLVIHRFITDSIPFNFFLTCWPSDLTIDHPPEDPRNKPNGNMAISTKITQKPPWQNQRPRTCNWWHQASSLKARDLIQTHVDQHWWRSKNARLKNGDMTLKCWVSPKKSGNHAPKIPGQLAGHSVPGGLFTICKATKSIKISKRGRNTVQSWTLINSMDRKPNPKKNAFLSASLVFASPQHLQVIHLHCFNDLTWDVTVRGTIQNPSKSCKKKKNEFPRPCWKWSSPVVAEHWASPGKKHQG